MKKLVVFAVCALMSATASFGVNFTFTEVTKVEQSGNGFIAYAGSESISISALQYTQMQNASGWYILNVDGEKTIAAGDEFTVEKLTADSVGLDGNSPKVFFTNGTKKTFTKSEWLKTLKGQTVRRIYINTPTWEFENFATMEGEFACHSKVVLCDGEMLFDITEEFVHVGALFVHLSGGFGDLQCVTGFYGFFVFFTFHISPCTVIICRGIVFIYFNCIVKVGYSFLSIKMFIIKASKLSPLCLITASFIKFFCSWIYPTHKIIK